MTGPTTPTGKAIYANTPARYRSSLMEILAIEQEAAETERERLKTKIQALSRGTFYAHSYNAFYVDEILEGKR